MPEVYKCTQLPTTHFPPIGPVLESHDDVQMFNDAVLASSVYVITGFACCIKTYATIIWGSFLLRRSDTGVRNQTWIKG